jgi:hypothetical protein
MTTPNFQLPSWPFPFHHSITADIDEKESRQREQQAVNIAIYMHITWHGMAAAVDSAIHRSENITKHTKIRERESEQQPITQQKTSSCWMARQRPRPNKNIR